MNLQLCMLEINTLPCLGFYKVCYIVVLHVYLSNSNHDCYPTYLRKDLKHYLIIANMPPKRAGTGSI